jgi:sulfatase modifying factor 1
MNARTRSILFALWLAAIAASVSFGETINMEMVTIGNPGNANDSTGYGGVAYEYRIGKYEVTIGQYTAFLNAVAKSDPYGLYDPSMGTDASIAGIARSGSSGNYTYSAMAPAGVNPPGAQSSTDRPIAYINWFRAARFANWMSNGQPTGAQNSSSTEDGAYSLNGATSGSAAGRNAINPNTGEGPIFYIPTENEWYKSAYYSPLLNSGSGGYYVYAVQSNELLHNRIGSEPAGANFWNYMGDVPEAYALPGAWEGANGLTDVGAFSASASFYGTFDQTGNVSELNDLTGLAGISRGIRGYDAFFWGEWALYALRSDWRSEADPAFLYTIETWRVGFRLASPVAVPEPSTWVMGLAGFACAALAARRRQAA